MKGFWYGCVVAAVLQTALDLLIFFPMRQNRGHDAGYKEGYAASREYNQREAIRQGAAHWVVGEDGSPKFEWHEVVEPAA